MLESKFPFFLSFNSTLLCIHCILSQVLPKQGKDGHQQVLAHVLLAGASCPRFKRSPHAGSVCTNSNHVLNPLPGKDHSLLRIPLAESPSHGGVLFEPLGLEVVRDQGSSKENNSALRTRGRNGCQAGETAKCFQYLLWVTTPMPGP